MKKIRSLKTVYHLLDKRNLESYQAHGLLSTSRLAQISDAGAMSRLGQQRLRGEQLSCGAFIRDQTPMPPKALARCLTDGVTPDEWYRLLNSKVFFWIDPDRLIRQRNACWPVEQVVLVIDAQKMLSAYSQQASVTPFNTGNAMRAAAQRNLSTFVPYDAWVESGWAHEQITGNKVRPSSHKPVELTLSGAVPDVRDYVTETVFML